MRPPRASASTSTTASCWRPSSKRGYLLRAYYYTALVEDQEYSSIRPLIDWLDYNGYKVVTKPAKEFTDSSGRRKIKGNMDMELAIDAMEQSETVDHLVIFSGDGDFTSLVDALQRRGRKVSVVSTLSTQPPMIADDLRRQADYFIDLVSLRGEVGREISERPVRQNHAAVDSDSGRPESSSALTGFPYQPADRREPDRDCPLCPRLHGFIREQRQAHPGWHNAPVPTFYPPEGPEAVRLLIVGLAPGLGGANRTGRPFTGDYAGDLLYAHPRPLRALSRQLPGAARTTAWNCAARRSPMPSAACRPQNKPVGAEINTCRRFLSATLAAMPAAEGRADARQDRPRDDRARLRRARRRPSVPPRQGDEDRRGRHLLELSLLPLQHQYAAG